MGRVYTQDEIRKMGELCEAKHDEEISELRNLFTKHSSDKLALELFRYDRHNTRFEIIIRTEDDWNYDELMKIAFIDGVWTQFDGRCVKDTFDLITEIALEFWRGIEDYVIEADRNYGREED